VPEGVGTAALETDSSPTSGKGKGAPLRRAKRLDPYGVQLHLSFDEEEWKRIGRFYHLNDWEDGPEGGGRTEDSWDDVMNVYHVIVYVELVKRTDAYIINTISHEAVHAAGMVLSHSGQDYDGMTEAFAYLVGFIAEYVWEQWQKEKTSGLG